MQTQRTPTRMSFNPLGRRQVEVAFDGGRISSDGGVVLLRETADAMALFPLLADCFRDHRDRSRIEHSVEELVAQRILALACGYEDLNDHDELREDPLFAVAVGKSDPTGTERPRQRDVGAPLAGHSTLNRIELAPEKLNPKRPDLKILHDGEAIERLFVDLFLDAHEEPPAEIVLDIDATDNPLHGNQEGKFFHGYYDEYCYLPLYVFCGSHLLAVKLQTADQGESKGGVPELQRIVAHIRERWPEVRILIRGDAAYCRDALMTWCEESVGIDYVVGFARNPRLLRQIEGELAQAVETCAATKKSARTFKDLRYQTENTWSRERRVVAKAEALPGKQNPRFIVTSLPVEMIDARTLYEDVYCARGDMENRIKEQQLGLFSDRTSAHTLRANQLRLWFSGLAYVLVDTLRRRALVGTELAKAQAWTLRDKLFKIGASVRVTVRRVWVSLSSAYPHAALFIRARDQLRASYPTVF